MADRDICICGLPEAESKDDAPSDYFCWHTFSQLGTDECRDRIVRKVHELNSSLATEKARHKSNLKSVMQAVEGMMVGEEEGSGDGG